MNDFPMLCEYNSNKLNNQPVILYELTFLKWIFDIIIEYNRLGFFTFTSQPGKIHNNIMYKSEYHRHKERTKDNILCSVVRKQRAYIRGYMISSMADFVFDKLKDDPYLFVRTSTHNIPFNHKIKFGSVNFINDEPVSSEDVDVDIIEDCRNIPDANWSFNLKLSLRRPFNELYPNMTISNIDEFEIIDIRWNENSYLWTKLLDIINIFKNIYC
jgi:hypothetical protein